MSHTYFAQNGTQFHHDNFEGTTVKTVAHADGAIETQLTVNFDDLLEFADQTLQERKFRAEEAAQKHPEILIRNHIRPRMAQADEDPGFAHYEITGTTLSVINAKGEMIFCEHYEGPKDPRLHQAYEAFKELAGL